MKRLLAFTLVPIVILAACGEPDLARTPMVDEIGAAGADADNASDPDAGVTTATVTLDLDPRKPDPTVWEATQTATVTPSDSTPTPYPKFPPVPEVTSCDHAADLMVERVTLILSLQWDVDWSEEERSERVEFADEYTAQMDRIRVQARALGCTDDELVELAMDRFKEIVADGPVADDILDALRGMIEEPEPTPTPSPYLIDDSLLEVDWAITTCEEAAGVFIERVQVLLLDAISGMTIDEFEAKLAAGTIESIYLFVYEFEHLRAELLAIGCTEGEVTRLIGERLDRLVPEGDAAEELLSRLREAIANNSLFEDSR